MIRGVSLVTHTVDLNLLDNRTVLHLLQGQQAKHLSNQKGDRHIMLTNMFNIYI